MDEQNIDSLVAFLNLLTAKMQLEEIATMEHAKDMMPILAKFIRSGELAFDCDQTYYNFDNIVQLVRNELGDVFVSSLNPTAAKHGNNDEIAKIITSLVYAVRIAQRDKFLELCETLKEQNASVIAKLIERLDNAEYFASFRYDNAIVSHENVKENCSSSALAAPDFSEHPSSFSPPPNKFSPFTRTQSTVKRRGPGSPIPVKLFESPVANAVNSPQGRQAERVYALEKELKSLKEFRDKVGAEKDALDEQCQKKEEKIKSLNSRLSRVLPITERVPGLEDRILRLEDENEDLRKDVEAWTSKNGELQAHISTIIFERDDLLQKAKALDDRVTRLNALLAETDKRAKDEVALHDQTRKRYLEQEAKHNSELTALNGRIRELESQLQERHELSLIRRQDRENEAEQQMMMLVEFKEQSEENTRKMMAEMEKIRRELELSENRVNELNEVCEQQKRQISLECKNAADEKPGKALHKRGDFLLINVEAANFNSNGKWVEPEYIHLFQRNILPLYADNSGNNRSSHYSLQCQSIKEEPVDADLHTQI